MLIFIDLTGCVNKVTNLAVEGLRDIGNSNRVEMLSLYIETIDDLTKKLIKPKKQGNNSPN
jgi:hypothetical protein